jgi:hypothetical protein
LETDQGGRGQLPRIVTSVQPICTIRAVVDKLATDISSYDSRHFESLLRLVEDVEVLVDHSFSKRIQRQSLKPSDSGQSGKSRSRAFSPERNEESGTFKQWT